MTAAVVVLLAWMGIAYAIGSSSGTGVGFAVFFAPFVGFATFAAYGKANEAWGMGIGLILIAAWASYLHKRMTYGREEVRKAVDWIETKASHAWEPRDEESAQLLRDYKRHYTRGEMTGDVKTNFENRLIAKAKQLEEESRERWNKSQAEMRIKCEEEQGLMVQRYGG